MERDVAWKKYDEADLEALEHLAAEYIDFISDNKTERECAASAVALAEEHGYLPLDQAVREGRALKAGDKVWAQAHGKALILAHLGQKPLEQGLNILGAHIDSPRLDLKQNPLYESNGFTLFDTHYYGGIKNYQWVTLPLALHGVIAKKDGTVVDVKVGDDPDDPVFCVTDLLIHLAGKQMAKKANEVVEGEDLDILMGNRPLTCGSGSLDGTQSLGSPGSHGQSAGLSGSCGTRLVGNDAPLGDDAVIPADPDADGGEDARLEPVLAGEGEEERAFSWKEDFGRPDTMIDALGAQRSLEVVSEPESSPESQSQPEPAKKSFMDEEVEFGKKEMAVSMVLGLVLGVVLFIVAPAFITNLIVGEYDQNTVLWNIVDGLLRVGVFVFYLWLIGRMQEIKRMFGYHGAEHKTIHCYEHGLPLTPENARSFPRLHVRCGTAFLIMVMVIAIFVYTVTPINGLIELWGVPDGAPKLALVILVRILLMPVIAGISYEITVKWAGSNPDNPLVKVVLWPGMQMQYLTTNEPDDGQIECAIAAMQKVLEREEAEEAGEKAAAGAPDNADEPATATA